jgi:quinol monooxygenase YgiN
MLKSKLLLLVGAFLMAIQCLGGPAMSETTPSAYVRLAELEIDPAQLERFKTSVNEEIEASIRIEPGVLALYAVSLASDPAQIRVFKMYTDGQWTAAHRGQGRAYLAVRLKLRPEAFPSGAPSLSAIVEGADTILDPRTGATGWSDNPALCLAWYLTSPFGWRAAWADIDLPALMAAANICDEIMGRRDGTAERRYTVNGAVTLGEGKIAITRKLVAAMAGALVVSGGRFYIHAGAPALPAAWSDSRMTRRGTALQTSCSNMAVVEGRTAVTP